MNEIRDVRLGACGWLNPAWCESFYPADMPDEWQLTYFNTQFDCVYLEQSFWRSATPEELVRWHADTHGQFLFLLEGEGMPPSELADKALLILPGDPAILWFSHDSSLKELAALLAADVVGQSRYLISLDGDLGQIERVATLLDVMGLGQ